MKPAIAIAMSGGVDSLVSAYLLKKGGYRVFGVHFTTGFESPDAPPVASSMENLAKQVGLPVYVVDLSQAFRTTVVNYFVQAYADGLTPNPCLICNPHVKFGALFEAAKAKGADLLATGHYARVVREPDGRIRLFKGVDRLKDQSYFLSFLTREQLSRAMFPLGEFTKNEIKAIAGENGLTPIAKNESQDVCFIHERNYSDFLINYCGLRAEPGPVVTVEGKTVGHHTGLHRFTVGQRRGINCPSSEPYYVVRLIPRTHTLVVGRKHDIISESCIVRQPHWIGPEPKLPFAAEVRLRYRHRSAPAVVSNNGDGTLRLAFSIPQKAPTPGQGAVFYVEDEIVGAGIIST